MFLDEVKAESRGARATCTVGILLRSLEETERDEIAQVLDDPVWKGTAICRALVKRGYDVKADPINRHRRRPDVTGCKCP